LACQEEFFVTCTLDVEKNDEHARVFALHQSLSFLVCPEPIMPLKHPCKARAFFPERLSDH
jgi:hypothetical protein